MESAEKAKEPRVRLRTRLGRMLRSFAKDTVRNWRLDVVDIFSRKFDVQSGKMARLCIGPFFGSTIALMGFVGTLMYLDEDMQDVVLHRYLHPWLGRRANRFLAAAKGPLFATIAGDVCELQANSGANLSFLSPANLVMYTAAHPCEVALTKVRASTEETGYPLPLLQTAQLAALPFLRDQPDDSMDTIVTSFTLCFRGGEQEELLKEAFRVLRPGGSVVFVELVAPFTSETEEGAQALKTLPRKEKKKGRRQVLAEKWRHRSVELLVGRDCVFRRLQVEAFADAGLELQQFESVQPPRGARWLGPMLCGRATKPGGVLPFDAEFFSYMDSLGFDMQEPVWPL